MDPKHHPDPVQPGKFIQDKMPKKVRAGRLAAAIARLRAEAQRWIDTPVDERPNSANVWGDVTEDLAHFLATHPHPERFLMWAPVRRTMHAYGESSHALQAYADWQKRLGALKPKQRKRWERAAREVPVGAPYRLAADKSMSAQSLLHALHWLEIEQRARIGMSELTAIFEFGGGYGSLCRIAHVLGFEGYYGLFDLPPQLALQRFYLDLCGILALDRCRFYHSPHLVFPGANPEQVLFVSTMAFSEIPLVDREAWEPFIATFKYIYFLYRTEFYGLDNERYFAGLKQRLGKFRWQRFPAHSRRAADRYLLGVRDG